MNNRTITVDGIRLANILLGYDRNIRFIKKIGSDANYELCLLEQFGNHYVVWVDNISNTDYYLKQVEKIEGEWILI